MPNSGQDPYPGQGATAGQIKSLADDFRAAADAVASRGRRGAPASRSPYRLLALHSVELYLNALLLARGHLPIRVRGLQHDLAARTDLALAAGLVLRARTVTHLRDVAARREYLTSRYAPELAGTASEVNRMAATLEEVARKASALIGSAGSSTS